MSALRSAIALAAVLVAAGCGSEPTCGPRKAVVTSVIDGDTVDLDTGDRVRYLMIDTPEITNGKNDCYGAEAKQLNEELVLGKEVELGYDVECTDQYGRLLAYVFVQGREVNSLMVDRGYACVLSIPPNGADRVDEFQSLEQAAKDADKGMWGVCQEVTCD